MKHDFLKRQIAPLKTVPRTDCGCVDCQKAALYSDQFKKRIAPYQGADNSVFGNHVNIDHVNIDHADQGHGEDDSKLSYYLNSLIVAKKPVKIWTLPGASKGGKVKTTILPGESVGKVYSWVMDKNGTTPWLILVDALTPSNEVATAKVIGYTPFFEGLFDKQIATKTSSGKAFVDSQNKSDSINLNPFPALQDFLGAYKWYFIAVIIVIMLAVFLKFKN